ncbi:uncharacterized protein [Apostichopus japonicus]|uniref:uncharacterized protein n=1 Tax=Stichopus japonicus TaxID=307972 RepID=UPI003AB6050B
METKTQGRCTLCIKTSGILTKQLACDHVFCVGCSVKIRQSKISCPKCRETLPTPIAKEEEESVYAEVDEINSGPRRSVSSLSADTGEDEQDVFYANEQRTLKDTNKDGKSSTNLLFVRWCSPHNRKTEFFCYSCETAACSKCLLTSHKLKSHNIASLEDFKAEEIKRHLERVDAIQEDLKEMVRRVDDATKSCKKDQERLEKVVTSKQDESLEKIASVVQHLLEDLKYQGQSTSQVITHFVSRRTKLLETIENTRQRCHKALDPQSSDSNETLIQVEEILEKIRQIEVECDLLKKMEVPNDLNLKFEDIPTDVTFGRFTSAHSEDNEGRYDYPQVRVSQGWSLEEEMAVSNNDVDFVNIVCIDDNWIAHVSNHYGSNSIIVKHYSLSSKQECRSQLLLEIGDNSWTTAKTAGHDRSILLACGETVHRISFRRKNTEYKKAIASSIPIEAITWDEFGVDCYILSTNRRDVYWLSMDGELNYLCALQTDVQSVASLGVNDDLIISLLDRTAQAVHRRDCLKIDKSHKLELVPPMPENVQSEEGPLKPYIMASCSHPESHFVLFTGGNVLAVGQYDSMFRFIDWVMNTEMSAYHRILDISVKAGKVYLLLDEKISVYKIHAEKGL